MSSFCCTKLYCTTGCKKNYRTRFYTLYGPALRRSKPKRSRLLKNHFPDPITIDDNRVPGFEAHKRTTIRLITYDLHLPPPNVLCIKVCKKINRFAKNIAPTARLRARGRNGDPLISVAHLHTPSLAKPRCSPHSRAVPIFRTEQLEVLRFFFSSSSSLP